MAVQKRKRNKPCKPRGVDSRGLRRGARPTRQAELEKVLAGKGQYASIESVEVRKDPIIFGKITGCTDLFFITQWYDDVSIEEILNGK